MPESLIFAAQQGIPYTASSIMSQSRGMGSSVIGRTEEERDLLRVEEECDVGGDDRLRIDTREEEVEEAIDDLGERDEGGGRSRVTMFG